MRDEIRIQGPCERRGLGLRLWGRAFAGLSMCLAAGCSNLGDAPEDLSEFNVVLIVIDTLRADSLGCYGSPIDTSPNIDRLAESGILFERAYSSSSITPESISSLMTGRLPSRGGHTGIAARPHESFTTLAEYFRANDYTTGFFAANIVLNHPLYFQGFDEVEFVIPGGVSSGNGPPLSARALKFAKENRKEKFFMYLHYMDPHGPYEPPDELYRRFSRYDVETPLTLYDEVRANVTALRASGFGEGGAQLGDMYDRYCAEIAHTDMAIGQLLQGFKRLGLDDRTLIVLTADHGEEFLEHGYVEHGWTLHNESIHVPLIFWRPDDPVHRKVERPVSSVDVFPTLVELLGFDYSGQTFDGAALMKRTGNKLTLTLPERPVIAELLHEERGDHRAIIHDGWKLIQVREPLSIREREIVVGTEEEFFWDIWNGKRVSERDTWAAPAQEFLFNIRSDPQEPDHANEIANRPAIAAKLRGLLQEYRVAAERDAPEKEVPETPEAGIDESTSEKLKALGYVN